MHRIQAKVICAHSDRADAVSPDRTLHRKVVKILLAVLDAVDPLASIYWTQYLRRWSIRLSVCPFLFISTFLLILAEHIRSQLQRGGRDDRSQPKISFKFLILTKELSSDWYSSDIFCHFVGHYGSFHWSFWVIGSQLHEDRDEWNQLVTTHTHELTSGWNFQTCWVIVLVIWVIWVILLVIWGH